MTQPPKTIDKYIILRMLGGCVFEEMTLQAASLFQLSLFGPTDTSEHYSQTSL